MNLYDMNNYGMQNALPSGFDYSQINSLGMGNTGINTNTPITNTSMANITPSKSTTDQGLSPLIWGYSTTLDANGYPSAPSMAGLNNNTNQGWSLGGAIKGLGGLQGITSLVGSIGGIYSGLQQLSLAKKAFKAQQKMAEKNYANTVKSYNTALTDRATSRGVMQSQSQDQVNNYINENKLS